MDHAAKYIFSLSKNCRISKWTLVPEEKTHVLTHLRDSNFKQLQERTEQTYEQLSGEEISREDRPYWDNTFQETKLFTFASASTSYSPQPAIKS